MRRTIVPMIALGLGLAVLAAAPAALLTGCVQRTADSAGSDEVMLRTYTIPDGFDRDGVRNDLRQSLRRGDEAIGSVELVSGELVVTAPVSVQQGVAQLLSKMAERGPRTAEPAPTVSIRYWAIIARPTTIDGGRVDGTLAHAETLQPVLREIMAAQGPLEFDLLEQLRLTSADSRAEARGRLMAVSQRVLGIGDEGTMADLRIQLGVNSVETRVRLDPGTSIVLAQSGYKASNEPLPAGWSDDANDVQLYYVISADAD